MSQNLKAKSFSIVTLFLLSALLGLVALPEASAVNETTKGTVTGVETWSGTMTLQGDVEVAEGAKLIVNAGTTVNIPYGKFIDVRGAICIGDSACGASAGSSSSQARFIWTKPTACVPKVIFTGADNTMSRSYNFGFHVGVLTYDFVPTIATD